MTTRTTVIRTVGVATAAGLISLAGAGTASAHVSAQPEQAAQGETEKIAFRVPNERPDAGTVKIKVLLPLEHPLSSVRTAPMPGWKAQVDKVRLEKPVEVDGARVTDAAAAITWTAEPGTRIGPDEFQEFEATLGTLPSNTGRLVLPTEQTYDSGEVVKWDTPPPEQGAEPEHPAPTLTLIPDQAGHTHAPSGPAPAPAATDSAGDPTARWLGGAGLAVGALGLGVGAGAVLRSRKER